MSPTSSVAPRLRPNAKPAAALITPSMPLAPLFAATAAPIPELVTCSKIAAREVREILCDAMQKVCPQFTQGCCPGMNERRPHLELSS